MPHLCRRGGKPGGGEGTPPIRGVEGARDRDRAIMLHELMEAHGARKSAKQMKRKRMAV